MSNSNLPDQHPKIYDKTGVLVINLGTPDGYGYFAVRKYLKDPATHSVQNETASVTKMSHHVLVHEANHKDEITSQIAARDGRTIFFVRTKRGADKLTEKLLEMLVRQKNLTSLCPMTKQQYQVVRY